MDTFSAPTKTWLQAVLGADFTATKHIHSHQDEVYKIQTSSAGYYLKISTTLQAEQDNLQKLHNHLSVPAVIGFWHTAAQDHLLLSELPGKNLVELLDDWSVSDIVDTFAKAVRHLHSLDARDIFPQASASDVLLHGDMALPNIIVSATGGIGYIDFGQLAFGTPELDLADAIWSLQRNLGPTYGQRFLQSYGPVTMTPKIEQALAFRYQSEER